MTNCATGQSKSTLYWSLISSSTFLKLSSTSGRRSRRQAAIKTPPAKQEEKDITRRHLILDVTSGLFLNCANSLSGSIPKRKVATAIMANVITFSVTNVTASILSIETRPASAIVLFSLILRSSITNVSILRSDCPVCHFISWSTTTLTVLADVMGTPMGVFISLLKSPSGRNGHDLHDYFL